MEVYTFTDTIRLGLTLEFKGWNMTDKINIAKGNFILANTNINKEDFAVELMVCIYEHK